MKLYVAFLSDGERAYPVCAAQTESGAREEGRRIVGEQDAYFISVSCVPLVDQDAESGESAGG